MAVAPVRVQVIEEAMPFGDVARAIAGLAESASILPGLAALMRRSSRPDDDTRKRAA